MTVFLIDKKRKIELTLRETGGTVNWNLPMNTNDFRVFKDVQNTIEFVVRDTDRKPVNMMDRTAVLNLYDHRLDKLLATKNLKVINEARGICKVNLEPDLFADWFLQTYSYQVIVTNADGSIHMLYVDANESQRGFFELLQGPSFEPRKSTTVKYEDLMPVMVEPNSTRVLFRTSSSIPGSMQTGNVSGVHTVAAYLDNFTGKIVIQGAIEKGVPGDWNWFDLASETFDHASGINGITGVNPRDIHNPCIEANLMWWRACVYNDNDQNIDGMNTLPKDLGKVTKLVFRN